MNAVEGTVDWDALCLVHITNNTREAHTDSVVAICTRSTVSRAGLCAAIEATESRLAPASAVQAKAIVRAAVEA